MLPRATTLSRGTIGVSNVEPNVHGRHHSIVTGGGSPKPFMWARPVSNVGERPSSRHTEPQASPCSPVDPRLPRPPPSASAFGARPVARQKPLSMSLDLFDLRQTPASRAGSRRPLASSSSLTTTADEFELPYATPRTQSIDIPIIVEDSWGDASLPPVNRTVAPITSARRTRGQQQHHAVPTNAPPQPQHVHGKRGPH